MKEFEPLMGEWHGEGEIPMEPPMKISQEAKGEFIVFSSAGEPAAVPESLSIIGGGPYGEPQPMHYFDARGVKRLLFIRVSRYPLPVSSQAGHVAGSWPRAMLLRHVRRPPVLPGPLLAGRPADSPPVRTQATGGGAGPPSATPGSRTPGPPPSLAARRPPPAHRPEPGSASPSLVRSARQP